MTFFFVLRIAIYDHIQFITYIYHYFCFCKIHRFLLRFYNFLYRFYKSSWGKSFDFDCNFRIFDFALPFRPEAKTRYKQPWP